LTPQSVAVALGVFVAVALGVFDELSSANPDAAPLPGS
jgi:hypothetical protein